MRYLRKITGLQKGIVSLFIAVILCCGFSGSDPFFGPGIAKRRDTFPAAQMTRPLPTAHRCWRVYPSPVIAAVSHFTPEPLRNTGEAKNNSQAEILSMMRAQNGYYYRPVISSENATWTLQKIVFASEDHWMYYYCFEPDSTAEKQSFDIYIGVAFTDFFRNSFNTKKQFAQQEKENYYLAEINGIEYAYFYHESTDSTIISWEQFDKIHTARLYGHFDQILEILPLLKLERVSYSNPGDLDSE